MYVVTSRPRSRRRAAGFTLVELMAVVTITGILAAIGIVMVRNHILASKTNDALSGVQAIRAAEESRRAEGGQYLSCSALADGKWYPMEAPGKVAYEWRQPTHPDWSCWRRLSVTRGKPTVFGFLVQAGNPGATYPVLETTTDPVLPAAVDPWYVIQVRGDRDGDSVPLRGLATSLTGEVYLENEAE